MAQMLDKDGFHIHAYRKWLVIDNKEYQPLYFIDFSPKSIINEFGVPAS